MKEKIKFVSELLRVKQWVKNTFIFFPALFGGQLQEFSLLLNCLIAYVGFCLVSSGLYILNDYLDRDKDRLHPKKAQRPLARSKIDRNVLTSLIIGLIAIGLVICNQVNQSVLTIAVIYIFIHLGYNFYAKRVVLLDVAFIAAGFQIRIWAGALASSIFPSVWLQMCVFLLALFLGFTKRRYELSTLKDKASEHRSVLSHYTSYLLDQIIIICSTLAITFYGLYTISFDIVHRVGNQNMVYSVAFVIYGIFRYLYLVHVKKLGDEPGEVLATDTPLLINVLLWIFYVGFLLYN